MSSKASRIPTAKDRLRRNHIDIRDLQAINRNRNTPRPVATTASAGSSAAGSTGGGTGNFLSTEGGTMVGPLALNPPVDFRVIISPNGTIDISPQNQSLQYSSNIQLDSIQPNSTTLDTIAGAAFDGQLLIIRTFAPRPALTIAQATMANGGNIQTPNDEDFELGDLQMIELVFDESLLVFGNTGGTWRVLSTGGEGGGGERSLGFLSLVDGQTFDGPILWDNNSIVGPDIVQTATPGVFRLTNNAFILETQILIEATGGSGASLTIEWEESVDEAFTIPIPTGTIGTVFTMRVNNDFSSLPTAETIVDATTTTKFVRALTTLITGTLVEINEEGTFATISTSGGSGGGGGSSGYDRIQDEGINVTQQATMNFIGSAVSAVNNPTENRTDITITAGGTSLPVIDTTPIVFGSTDATKQMRFEIDGFTTSTTRVMTLPDADVTLAGLTVLDQTWTGTNNFVGLTNVFDTNFEIQNQVDNTKFIRFSCAGATTGKQAVITSNHTDDRVITLPDAATFLAGLSVVSQQWTGTNDFIGITQVKDGNSFEWSNLTDATKKAHVDLSGIATNTTRTYTMPNGDGELLITPSQSDWDLNTFDVFNIDSLAFMPTTGSLGIFNVGFSSLGNGGFRANILNNGVFQWTEENVLIAQLEENAGVTSFDVTGVFGSTINISETNTGNVAQIIKGSAALSIFDPDLLEFGIGNNVIYRVDSGGIQMGANSGDAKFIANVDQLGFRNLGNFIEDDANGMVFKVRPVGSARYSWENDTVAFASLDIAGFDVNNGYLGVFPQTSPGAAAASGARIFSDSSNLNHVSIVSDRGTVDLEAGGGTSITGNQDQFPWLLHETTQYDEIVAITNSKVGSDGDATVEVAEDLIAFVPIFLAERARIQEFYIDVISFVGASYNISMGIYTNRTDGQNYPETRIVAGTLLAADAPAVKTINVTDTNLEAGLYWFAYDCTTADVTITFHREGDCNSVGFRKAATKMEPITGFLGFHSNPTLPVTAPNNMTLISDISPGAPALYAKLIANTS